MTGVYQITCRSNAKRYIGSAFKIAVRWSAHRRDLRAGRHCNSKLQAAWNKYGEADFTFETLLECPEHDRLKKEQFFLDFFRAVESGFNVCPVAGSRRGSPQPLHVGAIASVTWKGKKRSAETIARMKMAQGARSPEWKQRIADSKKKENGASRRPIAVEKRKNMARKIRFTPEMRRKISLAAVARETRRREHRTETIQ